MTNRTSSEGVTELTDEEEKDEQAEFPHGGLEGPPKDLEAFTVPGQLKYPEHSDQSDHPEYRQGHGLVRALVLRAYRRLG